MKTAIAYYRVSTARQGRSGLGIEAQRTTVSRFADGEEITLVGEFVEVQTGKGSDALDRRPKLAAALAGIFLPHASASSIVLMRGIIHFRLGALGWREKRLTYKPACRAA